jgi:60 kDa SS-A/Ro ribonucleoprotein
MRMTRHVTTRKVAVPQSKPINVRQVQNNAGGYTFSLDKWAALDRFLILGSDGGTFYVSERKLTRDNARVVEACAKENPQLAVQRIVDVSVKGQAPKNDQAVFALALLASSDNVEARSAALAAVPQVCRIPTHLFQFVSVRDELRGWSRSMRTAVGNWYNSKAPEQLAYQVVKYQQREGWSHRDLLRLSHAKPKQGRAAIFKWAVKGNTGRLNVPDIIEGFEAAKAETSPKKVAQYIHAYGLTREMVPTEMLNNCEVWDALLDKMPLNAMVRNLGKMTSIGLLTASSDATKQVVSRLNDAAYIHKSRQHPLGILTALKTYGNGRGDKGNLTWTPVKKVGDALDNAFYLAFDNVKPTGKRYMLALDVSGSMGSAIAGTSITCREATAALAMVTMRVEKDCDVFGFRHDLVRLPIKRDHTLTQAQSVVYHTDFGSTDCAQPMLNAQRRGERYDAFIVMTDNETWAGSVHVSEALRRYRAAYGPAKLIVVGMEANEFTINDPTDPLGLDVVGFNTATPAVMSGFIRDFDEPVEDKDFDEAA